MHTTTHYDIIADIHGRFDKLTAMMARLGYEKTGEGFTPPVGHKALFLGDLIDTKPGHPFSGGIRATLRAVKAMCDRSDALCLMGNHEFNAILFHTNGPDGKPLKIHGSRNLLTHQGTLDDFPDHTDPASEWRTVWLPWLKTLPFAIEQEGFRAVHACWHSEFLARLDGRSMEDHEFLLASAEKFTPEWEAVEAVLKGIEVPMPAGQFFIDHAGREHKQFRACWWEAPDDDALCSELIFPASAQVSPVPIEPAARAMFCPYPLDERPVFFGHYFKPADSSLNPERHNVACLDHSAATEGPLVAYRWKGEANINPEHYITSNEIPESYVPDRTTTTDPFDDPEPIRPEPERVAKTMRLITQLANGYDFDISLVTCDTDSRLYARLQVEERHFNDKLDFTMLDYVPLTASELDGLLGSDSTAMIRCIEIISKGKDCITSTRGVFQWTKGVWYPHT